MTPLTPYSHTWRFLFLGSALSGLLLLLAWPNAFMPGFSAWNGWLALAGLIPFMLIWKELTPRQAFAAGWIMGFIYFMGMLSWFILLNRDDKGSNVIGQIFFSACGGVYFGLFGASSRWVKNRLQWPDALVLPLAWTAWEYIRGYVLMGGWPWGSLGHTQYALPLRQIAAVAGVGGISFIIVWVNALLAGWLRPRPGKARGMFVRPSSIPGIARQRPVLAALSGALILVWVFLLATCGLEAWRFSRVPGQEMRLALVQGNFNTNQKWDRTYKTHVMERMTALHNQAAAGHPDLIVWAESCFPGILEYPLESEWEDRLRELIRHGNVPTLLTSNEYLRDYDLEGMQYHHYNSSFFLGADAATLGRYRKIKLVPFGEYIPYRFLDHLMKAVVQEPVPQNFEPGNDYRVFTLKDTAFSPIICYEDCFEEHGYRLAHQGARCFLAMANDGWAGRSSMCTQHAAMSAFLAIEHRAYLAKADMTGPTFVVDPWGRLSHPLPYLQEGVLAVTIHPAKFQTFFTRHGNIFPFGCVLIFSGMFLAALVQSRRKK
jgi:apolipoprotein N-acyltransferase